MNETPFEQFITLVNVDQKINGLQTSIKQLEQQNAQSLQLDESHKSDLAKAHNMLHEMRKEVDSKELEMKILDQQEADKKKRLDHVANHKEYQLVKGEIDQLKKLQHALEDGLMTAWNQLENAKKEYAEALNNYEEKSKQLHSQILANTQKVTEITAEINQHIQERVEKEKTIPAEWLEKYAIMRARVTNPVVPVLNGDCSACFYRVLPQDMQFLSRRKLVQCKDCFRLLYLPEIQQTAVTG